MLTEPFEELQFALDNSYNISYIQESTCKFAKTSFEFLWHIISDDVGQQCMFILQSLKTLKKDQFLNNLRNLWIFRIGRILLYKYVKIVYAIPREYQKIMPREHLTIQGSTCINSKFQHYPVVMFVSLLLLGVIPQTSHRGLEAILCEDVNPVTSESMTLTNNKRKLSTYNKETLSMLPTLTISIMK